jgi:hypothetical protein
MRAALHRKVGGAFTSTATQTTARRRPLVSIITNLLLVIVGDP